MRKTITALILTLGLLLCCLCGAQASSLSKAELYEAYQTELHRYFDGDQGMTLEQLQSGFDELNYKKSVLFSYYVAILRDAELERFDNLSLYLELIQPDEDFLALLEEKEFPSLGELKAYALGRQAESKGDWPAAIEYYKDSSAVLDSVRRRAALRTAGPTATPAPTKDPYVTATDVKVGDYKIDVYNDGTCVIKDYTGNANNLTIPETIGWYRVIEIGDTAFTYCQSLISVSIPNSVTFINDLAFLNCYSLTSINIPSSTSSIGINPFCTCPSLTTIAISPNNNVFANIDGVLFNSLDRTLIYYPCTNSPEIYAIPYGTTAIGSYAFYKCSTKSVSIPDSVTSIGHTAFSRSSNLSTITLPASITSIEEYAFSHCPNLILRVPAGSYAHQYVIDNNLPHTTY